MEAWSWKIQTASKVSSIQLDTFPHTKKVSNLPTYKRNSLAQFYFSNRDSRFNIIVPLSSNNPRTGNVANERKMADGILEVQVVNAKELMDTDYIKKMDPYVVVTYGNQEQKTKVARGEGRDPVWNETLTFTVDRANNVNDQHKIAFRIMDEDVLSADDFVGDAVMYVKDVISLGLEQGSATFGPSKYRVVLKNQDYSGEIQVGVTFTKK